MRGEEIPREDNISIPLKRCAHCHNRIILVGKRLRCQCRSVKLPEIWVPRKKP